MKQTFKLLRRDDYVEARCNENGAITVNLHKFSYEPEELMFVISHETLHSVLRTHWKHRVSINQKKYLGEENAVNKLLAQLYPEIVKKYDGYLPVMFAATLKQKKPKKT